MATTLRVSPSAEAALGDDSAVVLPASMQTLLDRYTERPLTAEERHTLARATPNVRCEALRIFFEMNDAAAAVAYVLRHGTPAPSSQRHSGDGQRSQSSAASTLHSKSGTARSKSSTAAAHKALKPLALNTANTSGRKSAGEQKKGGGTSTPAVPATTTSVLPPPPSLPVVDSVESPAPTPMKQRLLRPPSLTMAGAGPSSGSRPRRMSAARRGESMCTLVTVSSMSDDDDDRENCAADGLGDEEEVAMPPTVTLRSRESRDVPAAVPQVPALVLDAVLKPNDAPPSSSSSSSSNGSDKSGKGVSSPKAASPCATAPAERASRKSATPAATTAVAAPVRDVSPSVLPPPGAHRIEVAEVPPIAPAPVTAATATQRHGVDDAEEKEEEEKPRKTVAAKPSAAVKEAEPVASTTAPAPVPNAHGTQRATQHHHVAFPDATAMALLDAYRKGGAPPLGYRDEVELAYTELSCGHSSASPSCAAPSVASAGGIGSGAPKSAMDWAALVASVRGPQCPTSQLPAPARLSPRKEKRTNQANHTSNAPTTAPADAPLRTPRGPTTAHRTFAVETTRAGAAPPPSSTRRTPRGSQEDVVKRKSGGSGGHTSVTKKVQHATRKKRHSGANEVLPTPSSSTAAPFTSPEKPPLVRSANASPLKRGVAWDDTTRTYVTHPNQRRRQLAAAEVAAAAEAALPPASSTPSSLVVRAAGASALETPDVLHAYFGRTASAAVVVGDGAGTIINDNNNKAATTPRQQGMVRTPTATCATPPNTTAAFGRLCSSALHLSHPAPAPALKESVKTPRGTAAGCRRKATTTTTTTPSPLSATNRLLTRKRAAHTPTPVVATPRAHHQPTPKVRTDYARLRSGYAAPDEAAAAMGFQRLRSGYPVVHPHDVYREGGEIIQLQRQASRYPTLAYPSSEAMRRMASAVPAIRYFDAAIEAGEAASSDIQPAGFVSCPSTIRSPRTARMPHEECGGGGAKPPSLDDAAAAAHGGWASARGPLYNRGASGYHHRHATTTTTTTVADTYKISSGLSAVPATQCSVFERLTSNYYGASSSAAALRAPAALASPRGRHYATDGAGDNSAHAARRRHTSAPAGSAGRRIAERSAGQRQVYPALREGWLSPDGKVAATRRATQGEEAGVAEEARGSALERNTFTRSNTSRYLNLNK